MGTLLISDASVLIDMDVGNLSVAMFRLDNVFAVPDVLFEEELRQRHAVLLGLGLQSMELSPDGIERALALAKRYRGPSRNDLLALALALEVGCPLLTGDAALRLAAEAENVEVHGTVWLVGQLLEKGIVNVEEAERGYAGMRRAGSRLPWHEIASQLRCYSN